MISAIGRIVGATAKLNLNLLRADLSSSLIYLLLIKINHPPVGVDVVARYRILLQVVIGKFVKFIDISRNRIVAYKLKEVPRISQVGADVEEVEFRHGMRRRFSPQGSC